MRSPLRPRRSGTSLTEVLIAIFIMALGLMALLTLFPLGLLQMAASIKDERCAQAAANAEATARYGWKQFWNDKAPSDATLATTYPLIGQLDNYGRVYVDPIGNASNPPGNFQAWLAGVAVAGTPPVGTPRDTISIGGVSLGLSDPTPFRQATRRVCSLLDDINFGRDGAPDPNGIPSTSPGSVRREGRYNFAWLLTRRFTIDPTSGQRTFIQPRYEANLTVVVYGGLKGARSMDTASGETAYPAIFAAGQTTAYLKYGGTTAGVPQVKPNLARNSWVYDNQNGFFYRVVDVNEDLTATVFPTLPNDGSNTVILELQTPALANASVVSGGVTNFQPNAGVVMELISEVFDKGTISPFTVPELQP